MNYLLKTASFLIPLSLSTLCLGTESKPPTVVSTAPGAENTVDKASSPQHGPRFGVIDMQRIILSVEEGKQARAALEKEFKSKDEAIRKKKEELDKLNKAWKEQAPLLSEDARIKKQQDFQEKLVELRNTEMSFQEELKQKEGQATQRIAMNVTGVVDGFARSQNLDGVFELNSSGLVYLKNPVDLTDKVIKQYNATKFEPKKSLSSSDKNPNKPVNKNS
jgi:outer membrane protein